MISMDVLRDTLAREWDLHDVEITPHHGGMNSATWWVDVDRRRRWVAKSTTAEAGADFGAGLEVAALVARSGTPAGQAALSTAGAMTVEAPGTDGRKRPLALLTYVPGDELTASEPADVCLLGETLGTVHVALRGTRLASARPLNFIDLDAPYIAVRDWIRPVVAEVLNEYACLDPDRLTAGLLHTDPAPEAFRHNRSAGTVGLIDWSVAVSGPLLYDLASAVMYVGGPDRAGGLLDAYLATGALDAAEVERGLLTLLRYRAAVQAMYFAWRTANNDLTGISDASENEDGLSDARAMLSPA